MIGRAAGGVAMLVAVVACNPSALPTSPSALIPVGTHQSPLIAVSGRGAGGVSVTSTPIPEGSMRVDIRLVVADLAPNSSFVVQRAPESGRDKSTDGVCQRAQGLSPWSATDPAAPAFLTFPLNGVSAVLTTDAGGRGSLTFEFRAPTISAGTVFDVMFRIVDNETAPSIELRSGCFQVTVR